MIKSGSRSNLKEPVCKKIQNYIFKFSDLLGQGNFSKVYKAHHEITNESVAIKIVELNSLKSQKLEELLFSEIDVLKKLNHPNILQCFEVFTSNRNCYIITEICNGGDLETKLRKEHHFSEQSAQPIITDIFLGLLYLAQRNVIHRDLKIANVFLHNGQAKIADFGFAKFTKENIKDINIGSPIYMSPEGLIHNTYGPKTDVWAFGILIYELLHGETPYAQCRTESELKHLVSVPISQKKMRRELSAEIKEVITKCMEVDQTKRITVMDLEKLPYFQKILQKSSRRGMESPLMDKKLSSASQKYLGSSKSIAHNSIHRRNFIFPKEEQVQLEGGGNLENKSPANPKDRKHNTSLNPREGKMFSTQKHILGFKPNKNETGDEAEQKAIQKKPQIFQKILSVRLTFKQCVNLLHYCRLIYKYTAGLRESQPSEQNQSKVLSGWLMLLMGEIKNKIDEGGIIYDGQNAWLREKKLRQVANEYGKKYQQQMGGNPPLQLSLGSMLNYCLEFFQKVDADIGNDRSWLWFGHSIIMILDGTHLLKRCQEDRNYRALGNYKQVEQFLTKNKGSVDYHSYKLLRKKVSFIRQKSCLGV